MILLQPEHLMTEFQVKHLILFPSYWKILRFEENKINWYREGKVIFLSYSAGGGHHKDIEVFELLRHSRLIRNRTVRYYEVRLQALNLITFVAVVCKSASSFLQFVYYFFSLLSSPSSFLSFSSCCFTAVTLFS